MLGNLSLIAPEVICLRKLLAGSRPVSASTIRKVVLFAVVTKFTPLPLSLTRKVSSSPPMGGVISQLVQCSGIIESLSFIWCMHIYVGNVNVEGGVGADTGGIS